MYICRGVAVEVVFLLIRLENINFRCVIPQNQIYLAEPNIQISVSSQEVLEKNGQIYSYSFCQVIGEFFQSTGFLFCDTLFGSALPVRSGGNSVGTPARTTTEKELFTQDGVETLFCNKKDLGDVGHCNSLTWRYPMKIKWRKINRRVPFWSLSRGDTFDIVAFQPALNIYSPEV